MHGSRKAGDKLWGTRWERTGICEEEEAGAMWHNYDGQAENVTEKWKDKKWKNRQDKAGKTNGKTHHSSERM